MSCNQKGADSRQSAVRRYKSHIMKIKNIVMLIGLTAVFLVEGAPAFPGVPYRVEGISLRLRHSADPQAPGRSDDARVLPLNDKNQPAFSVKLKHNQNEFIGAAVLPEKKYFDFSGHTVLACDVKNDSKWPVDLLLKIHSGIDPEKPVGCPHIGFYLMPGETRTLRLPLHAFRSDNKIQLAPKEKMQARPFGLPGPTGVDAEHVTAVIIWSMTPYLKRDSQTTQFQVSNFRFTDELPPDNAPVNDPEKFFPMVDRYGQYRHAEWPGKIHSDEELREYAEKEKKSWIKRPEIWNRYGGYLPGPTLRATGFFRTEKYKGKWYLVDPEGKLFFSQGIHGLIWSEEDYPDNGRAHYYESKATFCKERKRPVLRFQAAGNRIQWGNAAPLDVMSKRLDSWGINTVGAGSYYESVVKPLNRPYILLLMCSPEQGKFGSNARDGFDPSFAAELKSQLLGRFRDTINDPMCIGYFITNEMYYGPEGTWAAQMMQAPATRPGKSAFRDFLENRYKSVTQLNRAWGKNYADFNEFLQDPIAPVTELGKRDLKEFSRILIRKFFQVSRDTLRECAPNHLFLGSRFQLSAGAAYDYVAELFPEYCDVASYNCYWLGLDHFDPKIPDMPIIISEFSIGGVEARGHFSSGLAVAGSTPAERGEALKRYYESALRNPRIVGMQYFCLLDQPICGCEFINGENMSLGVLDSTGRPYPEIVSTFRTIAEKAIPYRLSTGRGTP